MIYRLGHVSPNGCLYIFLAYVYFRYHIFQYEEGPELSRCLRGEWALCVVLFCECWLWIRRVVDIVTFSNCVLSCAIIPIFSIVLIPRFCLVAQWMCVRFEKFFLYHDKIWLTLYKFVSTINLFYSKNKQLDYESHVIQNTV